MTLAELDQTIKRYMLLADPFVVKLLCAYIAASRMPIPPPWLVIIASSSGGKSMLLNALGDVKGFVPMDDMTPNSFLSGLKRSDKPASLLTRMDLEEGQSFMVIKDFSTILSKGKESKEAVVSLLRKIYDGELNRTTGQGDDLAWEGKMPVLVGATSSFHTKMRQFSDLGERFIIYKFIQPAKRDVGRRILDNDIEDDTAKIEMRKAFREYLDISLKVPEVQPKLDEETKNDLLDLADLTTKARSSVEREEYDRNKSIIEIHFEEQIGRFLKQLKALAYGLIAINRQEGLSQGLLTEDRQTLYHIALDSIPMTRKKVLTQLASYDNVTVKALSYTLGLPSGAVVRALEDLNAFGLVQKYEGMGSTDTYFLVQEYGDILRKFENIAIQHITLGKEEIPAPEEEAGLSFDEIAVQGQALI